jgi:peptide/nickel transport system ATP-binding protein
MIFQEPMSSLSPVHTIGDQLQEALLVHIKLTKQEAKERVLEMLNKVGIPKPAERFNNYTFELSGGMRQRAMIAMALLCRSQLLIADEPTTALDVTTQATILQLIYKLQQELGMAVMFITHDLGVVAEIADRVAVMYLGQVVEYGSVKDIFYNPKHPYLQALLRSIPKLAGGEERLDSIEGMVPHPFRRPSGCVFHPRCRMKKDGVCNVEEPSVVTEGPGHGVKCHLFKGEAHV